jgi:hypothetical protein
VQELDQLEGVAPHLLDRGRLLDRGHVVAHMVGAAARRRDDVS